MKKLILVNGTMGVGKTTVCKQLHKILKPSVFLDGDWCWTMNPFIVNEENKMMVLDNIGFLLNSFLRNSGYEYVLFCWVMQENEILQEVLRRITVRPFLLNTISLICSQDELRKRLEADVSAGIRQREVIGRSLERLCCYDRMDTVKLDVTKMTPSEAAQMIAEQIALGGRRIE